MSISLESGFIHLSGLDGIASKAANVVALNLFLFLKSSFHVDITYDEAHSLPMMRVGNLDKAIEALAGYIVTKCERFVYDADSVRDVVTLRAMYLECLGIAGYGSSFRAMYSDRMGPFTNEFDERLTSVKRFMDVIYETRRDSIQDSLAYRSMILADSSSKLSRNTEGLTYAVLGLTWMAAVLSVSTFLLEHGAADPSDLAVTLAIAIVPAAGCALAVIRRLIEDAGSHS